MLPSNVLAAQSSAPAVVLGDWLCCLGPLAFVVYFLPVGVALLNGHKETLAIFVLNVLLGWTFLGWAVALVWAFKSSDWSGAPTCPYCKGQIVPQARKCKNCGSTIPRCPA